MAGARPNASLMTQENPFVQPDEESEDEGEMEKIRNLPDPPTSVTQPPNAVPQDPASVSTPSSDVTSRAFFEKLRKDDPFKEKDMFNELELIFNNCKKDDYAKSAEGKTPEGEEFVIQKVVDDFVHFNRVASVYTKGMHSMFIVSVWAASYDKHSGIGYVLYPKLTPLREMLEKVMTRRVNVHKQAMRKCFLPIAMAIDGLHTPVPNIRTMYYHRDICLDNIYIPSVIHGGKKEPVYGYAKLQLTKNTRGSHQNDYLDVNTSLSSNYPLNAEYFHHPDPWSLDPDKMYQYFKRHDWFSFGVYMLEVMGLMLGDPLRRADLKDMLQSQEKIRYFVKYGEELRKIITDLEVTDKGIQQQYAGYLDVAKSCIEVERLGELHHVDFPYEPEACKYFFEYPLFEPTARLLCFFDHFGNDPITLQDALIEQAKPKEDPPEGVSHEPKYVAITCQACQLRKTVAVPTWSYKRAPGKAKNPEIKVRASKCDKSCNQTYCIQCYVNGERLFCPRGYRVCDRSVVHGTTSTVIGHQSSYALILTGAHFKKPGKPVKRDLFEKDAQMLNNALTHRLICGMPEGNIVRKALYSNGTTADTSTADASTADTSTADTSTADTSTADTSTADTSTADTSTADTSTADRSTADRMTAQERLQEACTDMTKRIHRREWNPATHSYDYVNSCVNDSDFRVLVLYSGHGGGEDTDLPDGTWVLSDTDGDYITPKTINRLLKPILECSDTETCEGGYVELVCMMDHCRPSSPHEMCGFKGPRTSFGAELWQSSHTAAGDTYSEITYWFCVLMGSRFLAECSKTKEKKVCPTCDSMKEHITDNCFGAFIDAHCVDLHKEHTYSTKYKTKVKVKVKLPRSKTGLGLFILAHYNEGGVYHRVFPYLEEHDVLELDFAEKTHCANIIKQIESKVGPNKGIRLLTNSSSDSSKFNLVCDHNVNDILHNTSKIKKSGDDKQVYPSILYYQIIKNPVTVVLEAIDEGAEDKFELCLDAEHLYEMNWSMASQLPNILVYVVWHLRHLDPEPANQQTPASGGSTNQPAALPDKERARNSFATYLYETKPADSVDLKVYTPNLWYELEELASRYLNPGRERVFKVDYLEKKNVISIKWPVYDTEGDAVFDTDTDAVFDANTDADRDVDRDADRDADRDMTAVTMTASS